MTAARDYLKKISKFSLKLLAPLTTQKVYSLIVNEGVKLVDGEYGIIVMRRGNHFEKVYTNYPISYYSRTRQKAYAYQAYKSKQALIVPVSKTKKAHPELKTLGIRYTIHVPLSYKNQAIGVLIINSKSGEDINRSELVFLRLFGSMASLAIRKAQLHEETKNALELRDHFIAMAAHELRTPMTSVSGYIQLLYAKLANVNTTESKWIEQLLHESERLQNLINELLVISQIKTGKLHYFLKACNLREVMSIVMKIAKFSYPNREVIIEDKLNDLSDKVIADYDKLLQVFTNLVENAFKYSSDSSPVKIVLDFKSPDFVILVKDEGIGIPQEELKKIFEGYWQGSGHRKEGMGLGLFLVKDILTRLKGDIKVRSTVGRGTTMEVNLPKANI